MAKALKISKQYDRLDEVRLRTGSPRMPDPILEPGSTVPAGTMAVATGEGKSALGISPRLGPGQQANKENFFQALKSARFFANAKTRGQAQSVIHAEANALYRLYEQLARTGQGA